MDKNINRKLRKYIIKNNILSYLSFLLSEIIACDVKLKIKKEQALIIREIIHLNLTKSSKVKNMTIPKNNPAA